MISIEQLSVEFGGSPLFDNIFGFLINQKDKIALVGRNGAGKKPHFQINCRKTTTHPWKKIIASTDLTIGYLPQHMIHNDGTTVMQEAEKAFEHITQLQG